MMFASVGQGHNDPKAGAGHNQAVVPVRGEEAAGIQFNKMTTT